MAIRTRKNSVSACDQGVYRTQERHRRPGPHLGLCMLILAIWVLGLGSAPPGTAQATGPEAVSAARDAEPNVSGPSRANPASDHWAGLIDSVQARRLRGLAMPSQDVTLNSPLRGTIQDILVREGQQVEADQPLVRLDDRLQTLAVQGARLRAASEAEIDRARAERDFAKLEHDQKVAAGDAVGRWEIERAKLEWDRATAVLRAAEERRELAALEARIEEQRLDMHTLRAPVAGIVERIHARPGVTLTDQDPIARILVLDPLEAQFFLPVEIAARMTEGESVLLGSFGDAPRRLNAEVRSIGRLVDSGSGTVRVVMTIRNPPTERDQSPAQLPGGLAVQLIGPGPRTADDRPD
ncbi:MAG: efflux RND transporter periplasmic adaptor subunit [Phycisphaeraceae bacterium]|nr:efflux RND transporter periplasmic adaptor subunit [Phycisphaeraceae bacterium]